MQSTCKYIFFLRIKPISSDQKTSNSSQTTELYHFLAIRHFGRLQFYFIFKGSVINWKEGSNQAGFSSRVQSLRI